jgi:hypothetical protein
LSDPAQPPLPVEPREGWEPRPLPLERPAPALDLMRLQWGAEADVARADFFEWLYRQNPAGEGVVWYGRTGDERCPNAGHFTLVPWRYLVEGREVLGALGANVVVHPAYRRLGVLGAVTARVLEDATGRGVQFSYGLPAREADRVFTGRIGYREIGRIPLLLAPLDAARLALPEASAPQRLALRAAAPLAAAASRLRRALGRRPRAEVEEVDASWSGWDALWARLREKRAVMAVRDAAYVRWRFGSCPTRRYRLYVAHGAGAARGFVATRVAQVVGRHAGLVVDLAVEESDAGREASRALVAAALREFAGAGAPLAASLMQARTLEARALLGAGFFRCPRALEPQPFPLIVKPLRMGLETSPLGRIRNWFFTQGDYDAV